MNFVLHNASIYEVCIFRLISPKKKTKNIKIIERKHEKEIKITINISNYKNILITSFSFSGENKNL